MDPLTAHHLAEAWRYERLAAEAETSLAAQTPAYYRAKAAACRRAADAHAWLWRRS